METLIQFIIFLFPFIVLGVWLGVRRFSLYLKRRQVKVLLHNHPVSFKLQMHNKLHYHEGEINDSFIDIHFNLKMCKTMLELSSWDYEVWEKDYRYVKHICKTYNDALLWYAINKRIETCGIELDEMTEATISCLDRTCLHYLAQIKEQDYEWMQVKYESLYDFWNKKSDADKILSYFERNKVKCLYHFTDSRNLISILKNGGLYSWSYLHQNNIEIVNQGGSTISMNLDLSRGLEDFVHLSFTKYHPMQERLESENLNNRIRFVILEIHPGVAIMNDSLFSDANATSNYVHIGLDYSTLSRIDYEKTQRVFVKHTDPYFGMLQSEVMVKRFIPLKYILNLHCFEEYIPEIKGKELGDWNYIDLSQKIILGKNIKTKDSVNLVIEKIISNMVTVEGGTFLMGATLDANNKLLDSIVKERCHPVHQVTLSTFKLARFEVTQQDWVTLMDNNPSENKGAKRPVTNVSWADCQEFIRRLNAKTGLQFRLPTEAEWEYAARGGRYNHCYRYSGGNDLNILGWYYENSKHSTHDVGTKVPNELDIYDMSGNVFELCHDWYDHYSGLAQINPLGPESGLGKVLRGGAAYDDVCTVFFDIMLLHKTQRNLVLGSHCN